MTQQILPLSAVYSQLKNIFHSFLMVAGYLLALVVVVSSFNNSVLVANAQNGNDSWRLPFPAGYILTLDQAYFGGFSHNAPGSEYALDIQGNNIPIVAARDGIVLAVRNGGKWDQWCNSNTDCSNKGGIWRGNHIEIGHSDGSVSVYLHMKGGSVPGNIYVGAQVLQGERIGLTSYTGYTCSLLYPNCSVPDPHVHFEVRKNGASIPTVFEDCYYNQNQCVNGAPVAYNFYTSINADPTNLYQISGKILRLKSSPFSMKTFENERGSDVIAVPADTGDMYRLSGTSLRGPQNWCLGTESGAYPPSESLKVVTADCNFSPSQSWQVDNNGAIYLQGTSYCIAPTNGLSNTSLNQPLILQDCSNRKFDWGDIGQFGSIQNNCLSTFSIKVNYCLNYATINRPATLNTFSQNINPEDVDETQIMPNEDVDQPSPYSLLRPLSEYNQDVTLEAMTQDTNTVASAVEPASHDDTVSKPSAVKPEVVRSSVPDTNQAEKYDLSQNASFKTLMQNLQKLEDLNKARSTAKL